MGPALMIIKGKRKKNYLQSKFKARVEDKNKVSFANTLQDSNSFYTQVAKISLAIAT